jgi:hypothetical protein
VSWNVANTNIFPVNAQFVDILLSTDGGVTFPYTVVTRASNFGTKQICVPNLNTSSARLMVKASNGTFFNVSNNNFSITAAPPSAPQLTEAERDPMDTTQAFIYFSGCITASSDVYAVNGLPGATVELDSKNNRFIIRNIRIAKKVIASITATGSDSISRTSNLIIIPSIL